MRLIDGDAVIEHAEVNGEDREFIRILTDYIEDADPVEPKQGEWIYDRLEADGTKLPDFFLPICQCSECSSKYMCDTNYCPNCGAKMKGADECLSK